MVSATGVPTPLAQNNGSWADVGVRSTTTSFEPDMFEYTPGTVSAMVHLATSKYTYVGGQFGLAGNVPVSNIARYNWNSKTWHDVAGGVDGLVYAMARENEMIYVGGAFVHAGNQRVNFVAAFNTITQKWSPLNFGLDGPVSKLFYYGGKLTAIGSFTTGSGANTKGNYLKQIAQWDGKRWRGVVGGFAQSFKDADTCSTNTACSINVVGGAVKEASVINGALWVVTQQPANNVYSYDGTWIQYATAPIGFGGQANGILPGPDGKPLIQMSNPTTAEWRIYDQGLDNYILPRYITPGALAQRSFGSVAQLNILLLVIATLLVFIQ
jgi:hypothetical protein